MARKKTPTAPTSAPTAPPSPTEKRTRQRLPAKRRALDALKTIELAVVGHDDSVIAAQNLGEMLERLPDDWSPSRPRLSGPPGAGDYCEPRSSIRHLYPDLAPPYALVSLHPRGRSIYCTVRDFDGLLMANVLLTDLRRCAPPEQAPDVPQGDPAALGEPDDEPAVGDEVRL